jgi:methenyltetrahydromethanopterin cyclohydrolase
MDWDEIAEMLGIEPGDIDDSTVVLECGCTVEHDGSCPCGNVSPLLAMGLI